MRRRKFVTIWSVVFFGIVFNVTVRSAPERPEILGRLSRNEVLHHVIVVRCESYYRCSVDGKERDTWHGERERLEDLETVYRGWISDRDVPKLIIKLKKWSRSSH